LRIRHINIIQWRHFSNIEIKLDHDAPLVCVVGANGTGKSHILELIAACAHRLGLTQGVQIARGEVFNDPHDILLQFYLAPAVSDSVNAELASDESYNAWDRTLTIRSRNPIDPLSSIEAGGIADRDQSVKFASHVTEKLRASHEVHFLSLDADRSYPKKNLNINQMAEAYGIDWAGTEYTRGRSFMPTSTLYDEWMRYFLAKENQAGTKLMQDTRRSKKAGAPLPEFRDHFEDYAKSVQKVLPHIEFAGVDSQARTLLFDTTGLHLTFDQLSGGEREIAFLIGQIDRFGLRQGLLLIDEPELHLNADLIRIWVSYLLSTVQEGQIWLATHSLEAVEAAGQQATFILERSTETKKVDRIARINERPVLAALSRSVGTPAFSISQLLFVFIEGEDGIGEREHYQKLSALGQSVRFIEAGAGTEVTRRVAVIKSLASGVETGIRIAGVVDRDYKSDQEIAALKQSGIFVLPVHEAENFHLHPATLEILLTQNGLAASSALDLIRDVADRRAGNWIFQYAMATTNARSLPDMTVLAKEKAKSLSWSDFEADEAKVVSDVASLTRFPSEDAEKFKKLLLIATKKYARKRNEGTFWKDCEGKQVLNDVAKGIGFAGVPAMTQATFVVWSRKNASIPIELAEFRAYLATM
jgi:predicted ATPase